MHAPAPAAMAARTGVPLVYPSLPARRDLGVVRLAGSGLGNCLFVYFHAVAAAALAGGRVIAPTWNDLRIGPWLRGERSKRRYGALLRAHPDEIDGPAKAWLLATRAPHAARLVVPPGARPAPVTAPFTIVAADAFGFEGLHDHRAMIRTRLIEIARAPRTRTPAWGGGDHAAVHVRLGDFAPAAPGVVEREDLNRRIPLDWYRRVIERVRAAHPTLPVHLFSDGSAEELAPLLGIEGVRLRREAHDLDELIAMAEARLLIGSHSTFSGWAAFLGDMPSIWLRTRQPPSRPTSASTPLERLDTDFDALDASLLARV